MSSFANTAMYGHSGRRSEKFVLIKQFKQNLAVECTAWSLFNLYKETGNGNRFLLNGSVSNFICNSTIAIVRGNILEARFDP